MRPPVFMTGATGFLGMEVLARLLEAGDREVVALVRAADDEAAEARLDGVLETLWTDPSPYRDRVRAVAGDLTSPGLGIDIVERTSLAEEVGAVLHCAASISFDLPLEEARQINVEGTREMIGFAREAKALGRLERFLHVSTAYVAGAYPGTFRERQLVAGQEFRNTYEQTKWEAEQIVAAADDLAPAIVRPSIVMGESDSGWTPAFNVLYWPLRAFSRGLFDTVPALADGRVDVVPVDYVADGIVNLLGRAEAGVFNLVAGRDAPTVAELIAMGAERFARPQPELVEPGGGTALADGEVYLPYFDMRVVFDDARARSVLEPAGIRAPRLADYFGALIDYAEATRWGKQPMSRQAAREQIEPAAA
jgi:thioester reductase-like protein